MILVADLPSQRYMPAYNDFNATLNNTYGTAVTSLDRDMDQVGEGLQMTSILRKRKLKMNRHRHAKRQRALRFLSVKKRHRA